MIKEKQIILYILGTVFAGFLLLDCFHIKFVYEAESWYGHSWALLYFVPFIRKPEFGLFSAVNASILIELIQGNQFCRDSQSFANPWDAIPTIIYALAIFFLLKKVNK